MSKLIVAALMASSTVAVATPAAAETGDFYKGKTVTVIVGFTPGGGYDSYARILARFLPNHIPGVPKVIVQNEPGAGSLLAARSINATQPKDGTVLVTFNAGLITQSFVQPQTVKLDLTKLAWIGAPTPDFRVCYGFGPNGVKTWADMMGRKQFVIGSEGKGSGDYINANTLLGVFQAPIKLVLGFPGSADTRLAIQRGELDGGCGALSSIPPDWTRDDKVHPFVSFTKERPPGMPAGARFINDFASTQEQKDLLDFLDAEEEVGRPFAMSVDVPLDRVATIRKAFDETMKDPAFLAEAQKEILPIFPISGEQIAQVVSEISAVSPVVIGKAKKLYE